MPRLTGNTTEGEANLHTGTIPGLTGFNFTGAKPDRLGASNYRLITTVLDISTSVNTWIDSLRLMLADIHAACSLSPTAHNILMRVVTFSDDVTEVHGFLPLADIDLDKYRTIRTQGCTALYDAIASSLGAMREYGQLLADNNYDVSGMLFVVTDGANNRGKSTIGTIKDTLDTIRRSETLGHCATFLIGVNAQDCSSYLKDLQTKAGLDHYLDIQDATPKAIAKLGEFISRSVSSGAAPGAAASTGPITF